jgi:hypothetical protein
MGSPGWEDSVNDMQQLEKTSEKEETSPSWPGDVPNSRGGEFGKMYVVELACGEKPQQILGMM